MPWTCRGERLSKVEVSFVGGEDLGWEWRGSAVDSVFVVRMQNSHVTPAKTSASLVLKPTWICFGVAD